MRINEDFRRDIIRKSSIRLPYGGDTHFDLYKKNEFTVTTRLPGNIDFHDKFRITRDGRIKPM